MCLERSLKNVLFGDTVSTEYVTWRKMRSQDDCEGWTGKDGEGAWWT